MSRKEFWICLQGDPCSQRRARATGVGKIIRMYDPSSKAKADVRKALTSQLASPLLKHMTFTPEDLFHVEITAYFENPLMPRKTHNERSWVSYRTAKPDVDNLAKFYLDAANGLIWHDDAQVVKLTVKKLYSFQPYTAIKVTQMRSIPDGKSNIIQKFSKNSCLEIYHFLADFHEAITRHDQDPCQDTVDDVVGLLTAYTQDLGKKIQKLAGDLK